MPLVVSNSHVYFKNIISTTLKKCEWLKKLCIDLTVQMIMSFKVLKYFLLAKEVFSICLRVLTRSQTGKNVFFFRNLGPHNSRLFSQEKGWFMAGICLIYKWSYFTCIHNSHILEYIFLTEVTANFQWKNCIYVD